jgi:cobalt/nickel transport protein
MPDLVRQTLTAGLLLATGPAAVAHYQMLLPQTPSAKRGQEVAVVYQWGHPFEHQLFDAPAPKRVLVVGPDGKADVTASLEKVTVPGADKKRVTAYRFRFTPRTRGDYVLVLDTHPIWMSEEKVFFQDTARVVVHVQDQEGWDAGTGRPFELVPLTRPYGLQPGMVFQAQAVAGGKPAAATLVEVERYNAAPPAELPPDEQITRTARTDPNGVVTCTLPGPGWWALTALRPGGTHQREGRDYPVRQRTTLWVFVDDGKPAGAGR